MVDKLNLLLIPPLGHHSSMYDPLKERLKENFNTSYLDYPYLDDKIASGNTLENLCKYFISNIDLSKKHIIGGISLGGTLAIRITKLLNENILSCILMASGGLKVPALRKNLLLKFVDQDKDGSFLRMSLSLESEEKYLEHFQDNYDRARQYFHFLTNSFWTEEKIRSHYQTYNQISRAAFNVDYEDELSQIKDKILFLWGGSDRIFKERHYNKFMSIIGDKNVFVFERGGHFFPLEIPSEIANRINEYAKKRFFIL